MVERANLLEQGQVVLTMVLQELHLETIVRAAITSGQGNWAFVNGE